MSKPGRFLDFFKAIASICVSHFQVVRGFMRKGNAGEASGLPFVAGAVNCAIWLKYALLIDDSAMKLVNGIGVLILCSSSAIFYKYTPNKASALKQIVFALGFFGTISFYVNSVSTYTFLNYRVNH